MCWWVIRPAGEKGSRAMSWENREYAQSGSWRDPSPLGLNWPGGALRVIVIVQVVGWLAALALRESVPGATHYLNGITAAVQPRPATILLHPLTPWSGRLLGGALQLIFVIWVQITLGRLMQEHFGERRMVWLFVLGNFLSGLAYFTMIPFMPPFSTAPLDWPAGGLAAWAFVGWRALQYEFVPIGEKLHPLSRVIGFAALIVAVFELVSWGMGGLNLLVAVAFGSLAVFVVPLVERRLRWPSFRRRSEPRTIPFPRGRAASGPGGRAARPEPEAQEAPAVRLADDERELDALLAKISATGLASLSQAERDRLEHLRRQRLQRTP